MFHVRAGVLMTERARVFAFILLFIPVIVIVSKLCRGVAYGDWQ